MALHVLDAVQPPGAAILDLREEVRAPCLGAGSMSLDIRDVDEDAVDHERGSEPAVGLSAHGPVVTRALVPRCRVGQHHEAIPDLELGVCHTTVPFGDPLVRLFTEAEGAL